MLFGSENWNGSFVIACIGWSMLWRMENCELLINLPLVLWRRSQPPIDHRGLYQQISLYQPFFSILISVRLTQRTKNHTFEHVYCRSVKTKIVPWEKRHTNCQMSICQCIGKYTTLCGYFIYEQLRMTFHKEWIESTIDFFVFTCKNRFFISLNFHKMINKIKITQIHVILKTFYFDTMKMFEANSVYMCIHAFIAFEWSV